MNKTILISAMLTFGISSNVNASLASNAVLDFDDGITSCVLGGTPPYGCTYGETSVTSGSYFALDTTGNSALEISERIAISNAGFGLTLEAEQSIGEIDQTWMFGGSPGNHYTHSALTLITATANTAEINMTGWRVWWGNPAGNAIPEWSTNGTIATITCNIDCSPGDKFIFDYYIPNVSSLFAQPVPYALHLEGTITSVPIPSAVWLFGSGLISLFSFGRRKSHTKNT